MAKIMELDKYVQLRAKIELNTNADISIFIGKTNFSLTQGNDTIELQKAELEPFCEAMLELLKESEL